MGEKNNNSKQGLLFLPLDLGAHQKCDQRFFYKA